MAKKNPLLSQMSADNTSFVNFIEHKLMKIIKAYQTKHSRPIYTMSFGYTRHPLPAHAAKAMSDYSLGLGEPETYSSYEPVTGNKDLKQALTTRYQQRFSVVLEADELFITDGAQLVCSAIQELFSHESIVALQDPGYPAFIEGIKLSGRRYLSLPCDEKNGFIPQPPQEKVDILCLCFPNNPTGQSATFEQLQAFVDYALKNQAVIIFDATYQSFIKTKNIPRSIYEIDGAKNCAIEISSFSKEASFTGLRVGWCIIPKTLMINDSKENELHKMWSMQHQIKYWGPSNVAQRGALALLSEQGQQESQAIVDYYLQNAALLRQGLENLGLKCFGAIDNPYVWVKIISGMDEWEFFEYLMHHTGLIGTPGSMFGVAGTGYLRLSAFGSRDEITRAMNHLPSAFPNEVR
jgi:LL-diaminopimelate aminotransferase